MDAESNELEGTTSDSIIQQSSPIQQPSSVQRIYPPTPSSPILSSIAMSTSTPTPTGQTEGTMNFSMNAYASVTKLETGTFNDWKLRLTTVLGAHRLSKFILRDVDVPSEGSARDDYDTNCMRALAAIHATVDAENFEVIRSCLSPRDAFLKLCKHHDDAGGLSTAHLFSDLVTLRLSSEGDLKDHIHHFRKLHNDLLSNLSSTPDIKISEPFIAIILINSLPASFNPLVQSLLTSFESITLARLYSLLNIEATRTSGALKAETALSAGRVIKKFKKKELKETVQSSKDTVYCSLGHAGHTDENCKTKRWRDFNEFQGMMKKKSNETSKESSIDAAQMTQDNHVSPPQVHESYYDTAFSTFTADKRPIIMDTGASSHMFGDRDIFDSLQPITPTRIGVASKDGEIWARMKGSVTLGNLSLHNVLYSDRLMGNLISIGKLCDYGYTAVFEKHQGKILNSDGNVVI